ncbi:hypothetical protein, partial [Achromobacter spanius]|uniref:hypothetical protein n=1 Tax=Achromobacter spanius TaxID=217203 RepID=UPI003F68D3C0
VSKATASRALSAAAHVAPPWCLPPIWLLAPRIFPTPPAPAGIPFALIFHARTDAFARRAGWAPRATPHPASPRPPWDYP